MTLHTFKRGPAPTALWTSMLGLLLLARVGRGYPGGAPDMVCQSMLPTGHGAPARDTAPPYSIFVSKKSYKPGETLQVIVQSEGGNYFRGIFLQARKTGCNVNDTKAAGAFTNTDGDLMTTHCFGDVHSAVTHNSPRKKQLKTFYWTAPVVSSGHVVMRATIVREMSEYWTHVESPIVADLHAAVSLKCLTTATPSSTTSASTVTTPTGLMLSTGRAYYNSPKQEARGAPNPEDVTSGSQAVTSDVRENAGSTTPIRTTVTANQREVTEKKAGRRATETVKEGGPTEEEEEDLPPWLGPAFNQKIITPEAGSDDVDDAAGSRDPSWLIPAYQTGTYSSSSAASSRYLPLWLPCLKVSSLVVAWTAFSGLRVQ